MFHGAPSTASGAQCSEAERQLNNLECQADTALGPFYVLTHFNPLNDTAKLLLTYLIYRKGY